MPGGCRRDRRAVGLDPLGADDPAVMVVAGRVFENVARAFVEVVEGRRVGIRLVSRYGGEVGRVTHRFGYAQLVDHAFELRTDVRRLRSEEHTSELQSRFGIS